MASLKVAMCTLVMFLFGNAFIAQAADCRMEDFTVQANFDEDRYLGKWYEASWILHPWLKPEWNYYDFIHNYTKTDYGLAVYWQGRWPANATDCATAGTPRLFSTEENGKYLFEYKMGEKGKKNATHWVVGTDYDNYALVIGCREVASNGTCIAPDGWLWTRCQKPPINYMKLVEEKLTDFCLSKDLFQTTYHDKECRADIPDYCPPEDTGDMASTAGGMSLLTIGIPTVLSVILANPETHC